MFSAEGELIWFLIREEEFQVAFLVIHDQEHMFEVFLLRYY